MPIRHSLAEFKADIKQASRLIETQYQQAVRSLVITLLIMVAERTPVLSDDLRGDKGRAAGSWFVSTGERGSRVVPEGTESSAEEAIARATALSFADPYSVWWIYNNVPYIDDLEYGLYPGNGPHTTGGFSKQAPEGMLRLSLEEVAQTLDGIIKNAISK